MKSLEKDTNNASYIASLVSHLQNGRGEGVASEATTLHHEQPALEEADVIGCPSMRHQFPHINGAYRHIGGNALVGRIATLPPPNVVPDIAKCPTSDLDIDLKITPRMHKYLVENFFNGIHQVYPILDPRTPVLLPNEEISGDIL